MKKTIFVVGGCRSGKSRHALELGEALGADAKTFIATCQPFDAEMEDRVARHKRDRNPMWQTREVPLDLADAIRRHSRNDTVVLVDCLTLWMSNLIFKTTDINELNAHVHKLTQALKDAKGTVIMVSNEVGAGIVPENDLARQYRDAVGFANQQVAASADEVIWMVAGIPVTVKK